MTKITSCPVCRGEIHAIAGRCKHCKADLVELRERAARAARAQAIGATVPPPAGFGAGANGARQAGPPAPYPPATDAAPRRSTAPMPIHAVPAGPETGYHGAPAPGASEPESGAPSPSIEDPAAEPPPFPGDHAAPFPGDHAAPFPGDHAAPFPGDHAAPFPGDHAAPFPGDHAAPFAPSPHGTPPYGLGFAGMRPRRASTWSRRWPLVVSAVALLAIGISIGVLAERWRQHSAGRAAARHSQLSRSPVAVPDHMPQPILPGPPPARVAPDPEPPAQAVPDVPSDVPDPTARAPEPPPQPGDTPADPSTINPGSRFSQPPSGQGGDPGAFRTFSAALTSSLCEKLTQCGVLDGPARSSMCHAIAQRIDPDEAAEKVARGECRFDQSAADACLRAVADLRCDGDTHDRVMEWLMAPDKVGRCAEAYTCQ
jgi:hypothetical protein